MSKTIKDIARHFNVGVATASRAINNSGYVRREVREAIQAYVRENNWVPSNSAKTLKTGKSATIGILMAGISHYMHPHFLEHLRLRLENTPYKMQLSFSQSPEEIDKLIGNRVESVIVISPSEEQYEGIRRMLAAKIKVFGVFGHQNFFPCAYSNHYDAIVKCVHKLARAGHRRIGYLGTFLSEDPGVFSHNYCNYQVSRGFTDAMAELKIDFCPERDVFHQSDSSDTARHPSLEKALGERRHTALVVWTCQMQMLAYICCRRCGLQIPDDLSLIGLEGDYFAPALNPPPTHFLHNYEKFTDLAVDFIRSGGKKTRGQYSVEFTYVGGESIKPL